MIKRDVKPPIFNTELVPSGFKEQGVTVWGYDYIKRLKNRPGKIIKLHLGFYDKDGPQKEEEDVFRRGLPFEKVLEYIKRNEKVYKELTNYGINILKTETVIGKDEKGILETYTFTDEILGIDFRTANKIPEEAGPEIVKVFSGLVKYYSSKMKYGGDVWDDVGIRQFIFGSKADEKEKRLYLIDVSDEGYTGANRLEKFEPEERKHWWNGLFERLLDTLIQIEQKMASPVDFEGVKAQIISCLKEVEGDRKVD